MAEILAPKKSLPETCRIAANPADYQRYGIAKGEIAAWEDGFRTRRARHLRVVVLRSRQPAGITRLCRVSPLPGGRRKKVVTLTDAGRDAVVAADRILSDPPPS
jgi:hypothetical protein